jgi:hypothetical protein
MTQTTQTFTALRGLTALTNKVAIYVPGTNGANTQATNDYWVDMALETLSEQFGGATAQAVTGAWVSDEHGLIKEQTTVVYANASEVTDDNMNQVVGFAIAMCEALSQEAVAIEHNGAMYFVEESHLKTLQATA